MPFCSSRGHQYVAPFLALLVGPRQLSTCQQEVLQQWAPLGQQAGRPTPEMLEFRARLAARFWDRALQESSSSNENDLGAGFGA